MPSPPPTLLPAPLRGVIPPLVTPLLSGERLDLAGLGRLVEHVIAGGAHGLFLLGTTGEGPSLSYRLRYELVERACELVGRRLPVLVAVSDASFAESVEMAAHAHDCGASAVVATAPFYFAFEQPQLARYFRRLADASPAPLFLYNMPSCVHVELTTETVLECSRHPRILGLKDSSGDLGFLLRAQRLVSQEHPAFSFLLGPEELLAEAIALGVHGGIHGGANLFPELYVALFEAARSGDATRAAELHRIVMCVSDGLFHIGAGPTRVLQGIKAGLEAMGVCSSQVAEPLVPFDRAQLAAADECVRAIRLLLQSSDMISATALPTSG